MIIIIIKIHSRETVTIKPRSQQECIPWATRVIILFPLHLFLGCSTSNHQPASQFLAISLEKRRKRSDAVESSDLSLSPSLSSTVSWHSKRNSSTFGTFLNGNELPPSLQSRCRSDERSSAIDNERYIPGTSWLTVIQYPDIVVINGALCFAGRDRILVNGIGWNVLRRGFGVLDTRDINASHHYRPPGFPWWIFPPVYPNRSTPIIHPCISGCDTLSSAMLFSMQDRLSSWFN